MTWILLLLGAVALMIFWRITVRRADKTYEHYDDARLDGYFDHDKGAERRALAESRLSKTNSTN